MRRSQRSGQRKDCPIDRHSNPATKKVITQYRELFRNHLFLESRTALLCKMPHWRDLIPGAASTATSSKTHPIGDYEVHRDCCDRNGRVPLLQDSPSVIVCSDKEACLRGQEGGLLSSDD
jgi:hypothetical protein